MRRWNVKLDRSLGSERVGRRVDDDGRLLYKARLSCVRFGISRKGLWEKRTLVPVAQSPFSGVSVCQYRGPVAMSYPNFGGLMDSSGPSRRASWLRKGRTEDRPCPHEASTSGERDSERRSGPAIGRRADETSLESMVWRPERGTSARGLKESRKKSDTRSAARGEEKEQGERVDGRSRMGGLSKKALPASRPLPFTVNLRASSQRRPRPVERVLGGACLLGLRLRASKRGKVQVQRVVLGAESTRTAVRPQATVRARVRSE